MSFNKSISGSVKFILLLLFVVSMLVIAGLLTYLLAFNNGGDETNASTQETSQVQQIEIYEDQQATELEEIDDSAASFTTTDLNLLQDLEEDLRP